MSDSSQSFVELVEPTCRENREGMAESLNSALGARYEFIPQTLKTGAETVRPLASAEPGIAVTFEIDGQGIVCLIPESLPIPAWYREPNDSQDARLQTLPMEWAASLLPPAFEISKYSSVACGDLSQQLEACGVPDDVNGLEVELPGPMGAQAGAPLLLVWPLESPQFESVADFPAGPEAEEPESAPADQGAMASPADSGRRRRLAGVPVEVIVHIAGKKIDMRQLRGLSPGTLITFDKTCEELLEVYVANRLYCRGEAIKVGENFGIKVNEVDSRIKQQERVQRL